MEYRKVTIKIIKDIRIAGYCGCGDTHDYHIDLSKGEIYEDTSLSTELVADTDCYHWITENFRYALIPEHCFEILPEK